MRNLSLSGEEYRQLHNKSYRLANCMTTLFLGFVDSHKSADQAAAFHPWALKAAEPFST
jgi:hypothetical protein